MPPLLLFPEGMTSNNTNILKFKKGAFYGEKRVKPVILKYRESQVDTIGAVSPAYEVIEFFSLTMMQLSLPPCYYLCSVICLPDFEPNEYLFETHASKGATRWEVFAWAVRDVMIK